LLAQSGDMLNPGFVITIPAVYWAFASLRVAAHRWMLPVEKLKYLRSIRQVPQRRQFSPVHLSVQLLIYSPCCCAALFSRCSQFVVAKFTPPNCLIPYSSATAAPIILSIPTPFIRWAYAAFLSVFIACFHFFSAVDGIYHSTPYNSLRRPKLFYIAHNVRSFFFFSLPDL